MDARLQRRTVTIDDLDAVVALLEASDVAVLGHSDTSREDVAADLRTERLHHEGWYDDTGALVGYGWAGVVGTSNQVQLDLYLRQDADAALGAWLLAHLERRAAALVAEGGHDHAVLDISCYRQDERTRGWFQASGLTLGTTYTRMRVDFAGVGTSGDAAPAPLPPGVALGEVDGSEADLRLVHRLEEEAFTEHYGFVPRDFDTWRTNFDRHGPGWNRVYVASLDGEPVGQLAGTPEFDEENCGYVRSVCVVAPARGRGVARALLRQYFADCRADGRSGVLLHVDVANVTDALGVYESVGMRPVLEIESWTKLVPAAAVAVAVADG